MPPALEVRLLGPIEVVLDKRRVELRGSRLRALLALLAVEANRVVSSDHLIDALWGEQPPSANALAAAVARLRRTLPEGTILTGHGGYALRLESDQTDIGLFERLVQQAAESEPSEVVLLLGDALSLWRGPALAEVAYESWAQPIAVRLEELRRTALAARIDAQLQLGRGAELVGELEALVRHEPLHERFREQLMIALYRSGRQADALEAYRRARDELMEGLGLDPGPGLQELERAILRQDPVLDAPARAATTPRSLLACARDPAHLAGLAALAQPLALRSGDEVIVTLVVEASEVAEATSFARTIAADLTAAGATARGAAFASPEAGADVVKLVREHRTALVLIAGAAPGTDPTVDQVLEHASCDVGILFAGLDRKPDFTTGRPILVPFGGADHEWAALEVAAWLAATATLPLRLAGVRAAESGGRDASRLLATASLVIERTAGLAPEPVLIEVGASAVNAAAADCSLVVLGVPDRWLSEGIGADRQQVALDAPAPVLLVRRGARPGTLAPRESLTHHTWSAASR